MRTSPLPLLALLLSVLLAGVVAAESGTVTISAFNRSDVLSLALRNGDVVEFSWSATSSIEFEVERVGAAAPLFTQVGQVGQGSLTIPADGTYVFRFRNENPASTTVNWTITRRLDVVPWIVGALVAVVLGFFAFALWRQRRRRTWRGPMPPQPPLPPAR